LLPRQGANRHVSVRAAAGVCLVAILGACASHAVSPARYESQQRDGFVRIEPIEIGAPDNAHPASVSAQALRALFTDLGVKGTLALAGVTPLFDSEELTELVPHIVSALRKAEPREDVTFVISGYRGLFGRWSGITYTTGRLFVHEGRINVIFGAVHERYEDRDGLTPFEPPFALGIRDRRVEATWRLEPGAAHIEQFREDWIAAVVERLMQPRPGANVPPADPAAPTGQRQEIEQDLQLLERLRRKGLITDEEYRERRGVVLQRIR